MPAIVFAVNAGAVTIPATFDVTLTVFAAPANVPLGPLPGAVNVTKTPGIAAPVASFTVACRATANGVPTVTL